jgi:hypothetical protein
MAGQPARVFATLPLVQAAGALAPVVEAAGAVACRMLHFLLSFLLYLLLYILVHYKARSSSGE